MKAAVVYWSGTGNTAAMADLVLEGMKSAGADAELIECNSVTDLSAYDAIAFGCPAMGSEQLEDLRGRTDHPGLPRCRRRL